MKIESGSDLEKENLKLKKQLRELEMENEILKKAATNRAAEEVRAIPVYRQANK